jgi:hypothetical protein
MLKQIIKENLASELEELIRQNRATFERTDNMYYQGKADAYQVTLDMVITEVK